MSRHHAFKKLAAETIESLQVQRVVELNARMKAAGLPCSYGNKQTKARMLIDDQKRLAEIADIKSTLKKQLQTALEQKHGT